VRIVEPVEEGRRRVQPPSQGRPQRSRAHPLPADRAGLRGPRGVREL